MTTHAQIALKVLTHAVTAGFAANQFDPKGPNRAPMEPRTPRLFDAMLDGMPLRVWINEWRNDETRVTVAMNPTTDVDRWISSGNAGRLAGDIVITAYLERDGSLRFVDTANLRVSGTKQSLAKLKVLPVPSEAADSLRIYPRYLRHATA